MFIVTCVTEQMNKQASKQTSRPFTGQMKPQISPVATYITHSFIHSFHWHVQNVTIPCRSHVLLPFLSVMYFFLPPFSTNYSSILSHLILPSISWSTSQSCCSQILGILFSPILCKCPNQCNLFNLTVSIIADFLTIE